MTVPAKPPVTDTGELAEPWAMTPECFPELRTISAAFFYQCLPRPTTPALPEYVTVPCRIDDHRTWYALAMWNVAWEAGVARHEFLLRRLPPRLRRIGRHPDVDFRLVPTTDQSWYPTYAPLYHLLPLPALRRFGLPPLKRGLWPTLDPGWRGRFMLGIRDGEERLSRALAFHLWPWLIGRRPRSWFSGRDPVVVLALR
jgi:hypothetical protein